LRDHRYLISVSDPNGLRKRLPSDCRQGSSVVVDIRLVWPGAAALMIVWKAADLIVADRELSSERFGESML
jgi:hypothetical protein